MCVPEHLKQDESFCSGIYSPTNPSLAFSPHDARLCTFLKNRNPSAHFR